MKEKKRSICNPKVYDEVFKTYSKELKRFLYFKFNDMGTAEDALQEAFIKLWVNCEKVLLEKAKSYLYTIANNYFLDIKRHQAVVRKHQKKIVKQETHETPEFLYLEEEFLIKLEKAIEKLPEKSKEVFMLSRFEKMKYREIAEHLNVSIKTVEKRMHQALVFMREQIEFFK